jgi:gliding motility-associated-like protein
VALSDLPLVAEDCDSLALFCINLAFEALSNYSISDNGAPFTSNPKTCGGENQFAAIPLDTGFHRLVLTDTVKGCADTFEVQVRCLVLEDVFIETSIPVADSSTFCLIDYNIIPAGIDSVQNLCPGSGNATFNVDEETWCITVLGQEIGLDSACFKVFLGDTSVTVYFKVTVTQPCPDYFPEDFLAGGMPCTLDTGLICLPITLIEMQNKQFSINGQLYTGPVEPCDYDSIFVLNYTELPSDGLFGPYTITNWTVNDTLTFAGAFNSVQEMVDSMNLWDTEGGWTVLFDPISQATLIVGGSPQKKYGPMDVVQDLTGSEVTLGINLTYIPFGVMIEVPVGTYELTLTDTVTLCTETVTVEMTCVTSEIVRDTIQAGITDTLCLDISELLGTVNSIENICPSTGDTVLFSIDSTCVIYQGIAVGPDTACMVVCDDVGVCDTTYFYIQVILPDEQPPVAVNDTVVTGQDNVTTIFVLENDTIVLTEEFAIIDPPLHGDAVFLPDGTVSYVPQTAYCNDAEPDRFTYEICNPFGCDTAIVFITVQCGELEIFNAFSPNSDEINDFFRINGLQNYPDHKLIVFNRWGNRVFEANNYQNDWNGIWNGKELPDGTYFYYLDLGDGESPRSGYLQLNR